MKKNARIIFLTTLTCLVFSKYLFSTIIYSEPSSSSNNWNDTDTWIGGVIPTNLDTAIIDGSDIYISSTDSVSVLRLEIHNAKNIENSYLLVKDDGVLKVLGDLYMTADNHDYDVVLTGQNFSKIYIDGNTLINRLSSNNKGEKLRINTKNSSQFYTAGSFTYNYEGSSLFETSYDVFVQESSKFEVGGATVFNIISGSYFSARVTNSGELILNGGLTTNMSGGLSAIIESNETALLKIIGNVNLINTNTTNTSYDLRLQTGTNGGNIVIDGDLKLSSIVDRADVELVSEAGVPNITITGDLILEADHDETAMVKLGATATLYLGGDIKRPKNYGKIEMADFSVIELNGDIQQTIPSVKLSNAGTDSLYFRQILFNNTNGFILDGDVIIYDSLVLKSGIFTTTDDDMLIIADGAKVSAGNDTAYVDGPMTKIGAVENESFIFPLGDNEKYAPVEIIPLGTSPTSAYTGKYEKCPPPFDKITSAPLTQISGTQFWEITRTAGSQNFDVALHWQDAQAEGINDTDSLVVAGLNSTTETWVTMGNSGITGGTGDGVQGSVRNDVKCPPPFDRILFTYGTHPASLNALPSEMISFDGKKIKKNVQLNWVTASEVSSDLFIVERSTDGASFEEITRVPAQGNSSTLKQYKVEDKSPVEGINYYKLQRVDLDGSTLPTEIIAVNFTKENGTIGIYPNPIQDVVNILLENEMIGDVTIEVFNQNGQMVFEGGFQPSGNELNIPIQQLNIKNRGAYVILYRDEARTETLRFIKVN